MDWGTIATLGVGALGPIAVQGITTLSRRGDRKHQSELESDKQVWEHKREALLAVIHWAKGLQAEAAPVRDPIKIPYRRADVLLFANPMKLSDEVTAYANEKVLTDCERLQDLIEDATRFPVALMLWQLAGHRKEREKREEASVKAQAESEKMDELFKAGNAAAEEAKMQKVIDDAASKFDPDEVHRLAGELLGEARKDLRGSRP